MATSGSTTTLATVREIVTDALLELQVIGAGHAPSSRDADFVMKRLNWMLKQWQDDGVNLWRQEDVEIDWTADTAEGDVLGPDDAPVNDILSLRYTGLGYDRELTRWEIADYNALPNKTTAGIPAIYCVTRGLSTLRLRVWPVPEDDLTFQASINRVIEDVTSLNETLDVPQQYTRTVAMNLAANIAPAFGKATDPNTVVTIREAARLYQLMRAADRPASYFLGPLGGRRYG